MPPLNRRHRRNRLIPRSRRTDFQRCRGKNPGNACAKRPVGFMMECHETHRLFYICLLVQLSGQLDGCGSATSKRNHNRIALWERHYLMAFSHCSFGGLLPPQAWPSSSDRTQRRSGRRVRRAGRRAAPRRRTCTRASATGSDCFQAASSTALICLSRTASRRLFDAVHVIARNVSRSGPISS